MAGTFKRVTGPYAGYVSGPNDPVIPLIRDERGFNTRMTPRELEGARNAGFLRQLGPDTWSLPGGVSDPIPEEYMPQRQFVSSTGLNYGPFRSEAEWGRYQHAVDDGLIPQGMLESEGLANFRQNRQPIEAEMRKRALARGGLAGDFKETPSGNIQVSNSNDVKLLQRQMNGLLEDPKNWPTTVDPNMDYPRFLQNELSVNPKIKPDLIRRKYEAQSQASMLKSGKMPSRLDMLKEQTAEANLQAAQGKAREFDPNIQADAANKKFRYAKLRDNSPGSVLAANNLPTESLNKAAGADKEIMPTLTTSQGLINQLKSEGMPQTGQSRQRFLQQTGQLTLSMANLYQRGANFTDMEKQLVEALFGDPEGFWARLSSADAIHRLRTFQKILLRNSNTLYGGPYEANYENLSQDTQDPELKQLIDRRQFNVSNMQEVMPFVDVTYVHPDGRVESVKIPDSKLEYYRDKAERTGGTFKINNL
jgi:hypothetical protein